MFPNPRFQIFVALMSFRPKLCASKNSIALASQTDPDQVSTSTLAKDLITKSVDLMTKSHH